MRTLVKNEDLKLRYKKGNGAWTYHIVIPDTADIEGKWGDLKVSGTIDNCEINELNLAPRKDDDKNISVNKEIRETIGKTGGDMVRVTLFLQTKDRLIDESELRESFEVAGLIKEFEDLTTSEVKNMLKEVNAQTSEQKRVDKINEFISKLEKK
ncbi:DUF1905 domain-containing protein [Gracilimonas amylolytica]|uniref:DUF1905 domain-containing protein n=1 Tax=Gracilimonas amylolytica TaxID=1749045 RepID=UPI000CD94E71|nr:DUF1905 domain-containing protein [Gracilimonas amylolytica]